MLIHFENYTKNIDTLVLFVCYKFIDFFSKSQHF